MQPAGDFILLLPGVRASRQLPFYFGLLVFRAESVYHPEMF